MKYALLLLLTLFTILCGTTIESAIKEPQAGVAFEEACVLLEGGVGFFAELVAPISTLSATQLRNSAGTVSFNDLKNVDEIWLKGSHGNAGNVPQVAQQLQGQTVNNSCPLFWGSSYIRGYETMIELHDELKTFFAKCHP